MRQQDKIDKQLKSKQIITDHILEMSPNLQFSSGRPVKHGDTLFNGFINSERKFIILHPDELGTVYEEDEEYPDLEYPILALKYKTNGN
jgi:hypothetical protein